jgi:hypothetical protein
MSAGTIIEVAPCEEPWIHKVVAERGLTPGLVGLADAKAEDQAASLWSDCDFDHGD